MSPDTPDLVTIPHTEVHRLHSARVGADFELWVAHPVAGVMPMPPGPRPVLYVLDANLFFGTAVEATRLMAQLYAELPPMLVVGIAYGTDDPVVQAELRARDFTPTPDSGFEAMAASLPGGREPTLPEGERLGRADRFLAFLTDEVLPFVESRFDADPDSATLFGSSLGGLFVLHALFDRPTTFGAHVAVSPAIWWDGDRVLDAEAAYAGAHPDLATKLVLAVGALEENPAIPMLAQFKMVSNVRSLAERLESRGYPSLTLSSHVLSGESHTSVVAPALTRALREVHRRPPPRFPAQPAD